MEYTFLDCTQYVGAGINSLVSISDGLEPSFSVENGKNASYEGSDGWKGCLFPARVGIFNFDVAIYKVLFPICTLTWCVKIVFAAGKRCK